jgi:hypothetical protein
MIPGDRVDKIRRSLTPPLGVPTGGVDGGVHATRRAGARHEVSRRVTLQCLGGKRGDAVLDGWALNVSRGGIRVILEDKVEPGEEFDITLVDGATAASASDSPVSTRARRGCVVWVQEEHDGVVAGIAFKGAQVQSDPPAPPKPDGG